MEFDIFKRDSRQKRLDHVKTKQKKSISSLDRENLFKRLSEDVEQRKKDKSFRESLSYFNETKSNQKESSLKKNQMSRKSSKEFYKRMS